MSEQALPGIEFGQDAPASRGSGGRRRRYAKPRLEHFGDVRGLTMGGSPGMNDSGAPLLQDPLGGFQGPPYPPAG